MTMKLDGPWQVSSYTGSNGGTCVETRRWGGAVDVRDTKDRQGGTLSVPPEAWAAFVGGIKAGNFQ
jgi:hypothetical protein